MTTDAGQAFVHIWIASEWRPVRAAFTGYLGSLALAPEGVSVLSDSIDPASMTGRVAGWIRKHLAETGIDVAVDEAVAGAQLPNVPDCTTIGITELLLDPDPTQADQLYAIGIWSRIAPRRKRWMMRVSPYLNDEIVGNAAAAGPILLVQVAEWRGQRVVIASGDLVAAEVIGRAFRSIAQPAGDIGINPWETDLVRIASERQLGVTSGARIRMVLARAGNMPPDVAAEFRAMGESIGRLVDCAVVFEP